MSERCAYCGTELTDDGEDSWTMAQHEVADGRLHTVNGCREYVYAALQACKREVAELSADKKVPKRAILRRKDGTERTTEFKGAERIIENSPNNYYGPGHEYVYEITGTEVVVLYKEVVPRKKRVKEDE